MFPAARPGLALLGWLTAMPAVARQRRALRELDDARLNDIGLSPRQAAAEAARPVWDVPAHWLR
ncbi:MAG: DUF1127 domain-containing protein [Limimaricola sp.]|nr:DUF1127 domain-containing protein [Limimaricola sp.]